MSVLLWLANSRVGRAVSAILAFLAAAGGVYLKGRADAKNKAEAKNTKRRLKAVLKKQKDQDDVSQIDDTSLADRITRRR